MLAAYQTVQTQGIMKVRLQNVVCMFVWANLIEGASKARMSSASAYVRSYDRNCKVHITAAADKMTA